MTRAGLAALAAAALTAGGLETAVAVLAARQPARALMTASEPQGWAEIVRPLALYDLAGTEFARLPLAYRARRHRPDGAREDVLTFGALGDDKPFLQLSLLRRGDDAAEEDARDPLPDGLARLAATRGLMATRIRAALPVDTRFGRFEAADLLLSRGGTVVPCLGFRGAPDGGLVLRMAGFACGAPGRPMGRAALSCAINRIDLLAAGDDGPLRAVFVAAERRDGSACAGGLAAAGSPPAPRHRADWLDPQGDMPTLRGMFSATLQRR